MSLAENLAAAKAAVAYVKSTKIKASNKISDRIAAAGGIENVIGTGQGVRTMQLGPAGKGVGKSRGLPPATDCRTKVAHYISTGFGNCQEQAEIAMLQLFDANVTPLDLVQFTAKDYDHVWVVIGLHIGAFSNDLRSWGDEAVWCDPWQSDGLAVSIDDIVKGKVRNMSAQYMCDSVERIQAGMPISVARWE